MATDFESGGLKEVELEAGVVRYRELGRGEPLVFVHGVLVNGNLWRKVVPGLAEDYRCIVPDLPLGGHTAPISPGADLSVSGLARLISDFFDPLDLREATLVANDTGGAISQVFVARYPERVSRFVLTNADAFENFLPPLLRPLQWSVRVPGFVSLLSLLLRPHLAQRALFASVAKYPVERRVMEAYLAPLLEDGRVRSDLRKVVRGISNRYTIEAAESFPGFEKPVLLAWGTDDRLLFPYRYAERLAERFPFATLEKVPDARTFVPEDNPERLVELIQDFMESKPYVGKG
ncbi:MAG: alpha/beta fold hydrolase [Rubrobacteraceae bacterium]